MIRVSKRVMVGDENPLLILGVFPSSLGCSFSNRLMSTNLVKRESTMEFF